MLGFWELKESCGELLGEFSFSEKEQMEFSTISNDKRKCEFMAVRLLLHEMLRCKKELYYSGSGKPLLEDGLNISISHSPELAVVLLADKPAGIDVESMHRRTDRIAKRFLSDIELQHVNSTPDPAYTRIIYWCAKEALFKCTPHDGIDFKSQILIKPFLPAMNMGNFSGQLLKNNQPANYIFNYCIVSNSVVVYCTEEESL